MVAKRAELDSLEAAGWSLDSLAALRGGFERHEDVTRGTALLGGREQLDSLVFGRSKPPVLRPGETSPWSEFPLGMARVRLLERHDPDPLLRVCAEATTLPTAPPQTARSTKPIASAGFAAEPWHPQRSIAGSARAR